MDDILLYTYKKCVTHGREKVKTKLKPLYFLTVDDFENDFSKVSILQH